MSWDYAPIIEPGGDEVIDWGFSTSADRLFFRLRHTDVATSDPWTDDFDGDGVPNIAELQQGTDPFSDIDANDNGTPDDYETFQTSDIDQDGLAAYRE